MISHEIGQWCVYPELRRDAEIHRLPEAEELRDLPRLARGQRHGATRPPTFLLASGKLQTLCYKEDIESALRTPGMGGFQLLDLHDFPGQGTALVGVLDPFWEAKGYVTAEEYRRFCDSTVPLARLTERVFTTDGHAGGRRRGGALRPGAARRRGGRVWKLVGDDGQSRRQRRAAGDETSRSDNGIALGRVTREPREGRRARGKYRLVVRPRGHAVRERLGRLGLSAAAWTRPRRRASPWLRELDERRRCALAGRRQGAPAGSARPGARGRPGKVELGFSSIFWNTAWTRRQAPHTLGILATRSIRRSPRSRPSTTATGSGGIWSAARER